MEKAKEYFVKLELGLEEESPNHVLFRNDSGYVQVKICEVQGTELEVETRGFDQQVKQFLQRIG